ncbi:MAG: YceI family protein [Pseudomonadota bacterium]
MRVGPVLAATLVFAAPSLALSNPYVLDRSHAHVTFEVDHLGFSTVHGQFREFDAQIEFDPENVESTKVRFVIEAASIDTLWEERDKHLRAADFFDVENHPQIVFESTSVKPTGGETAEVTGNLTMRGVTNEVTVLATLNKLGPSPFDPNRTVAGFTVSGDIDRTDFGMSYAAPAVSAIIPLRVDLEMSPAQ